MSDNKSSPTGLRRRTRLSIGRALGAAPADDKHARSRAIAELDPVDDCVEVYKLFMADFKAASSFAITAGLFVTYAVPRISRVLTQSRQLEDRFFKRLVDTMLLDMHYHEEGFGPGPGRDAIRRVNEMHRKYDIHPEDYVFIGCWEAVMFIWFAETYGWRPVSEKEKLAAVEFAKLRGRHMYGGENKMPYPETYEEMQNFCADYLDAQLAYEPQNERLADTLVEFMLKDYPAPLRRPLRAFFLSVGPDERLITTCGYAMPSLLAQKLSRNVMKLYGKLDPLVDGLSPLAQKMVDEVYGDGYDITTLGTHLKAAEATTASVPGGTDVVIAAESDGAAGRQVV